MLSHTPAAVTHYALRLTTVTVEHRIDQSHSPHTPAMRTHPRELRLMLVPFFLPAPPRLTLSPYGSCPYAAHRRDLRLCPGAAPPECGRSLTQYGTCGLTALRTWEALVDGVATSLDRNLIHAGCDHITQP